MNDIARERQMVEENSSQNNDEDVSIEEEHRRAQESGEVFEGGHAGVL